MIARLPPTGTTAAVRRRVQAWRDPEALAALARRALRAQADWQLEPPRIWPKPGGRFVILARNRGRGPAFLTAYLFPEGTSLPEIGGDAGTALADESALLQPFPHDFRLRSLARLLDPVRLGKLLGSAVDSVEPIAYWPGKRAVLRLSSASGASYLKAFREPTSADAAASALAALERCGLRVPELLAASREPPFIVTRELAGSVLHAAGPALGLEGLADAGRLLARLHRAEPPPDARTFDAAAEIAVTASWLAVATDLDPDLGARAQAAWTELTSRLPGPVPAPELIHRDFHDHQVLATPGLLPALLDLDTLALGEPELDLGNFEAHLVLRSIEHGEEALLAGRTEAFRAGYADGRRPPDPHRRALYGASALLRLSGVYSLRPCPPGTTLRLADRALTLLR